MLLSFFPTLTRHIRCCRNDSGNPGLRKYRNRSDEKSPQLISTVISQSVKGNRECIRISSLFGADERWSRITRHFTHTSNKLILWQRLPAVHRKTGRRMTNKSPSAFLLLTCIPSHRNRLLSVHPVLSRSHCHWPPLLFPGHSDGYLVRKFQSPELHHCAIMFQD
jgi:hypothetical protein